MGGELVGVMGYNSSDMARWEGSGSRMGENQLILLKVRKVEIVDWYGAKSGIEV